MDSPADSFTRLLGAALADERAARARVLKLVDPAIDRGLTKADMELLLALYERGGENAEALEQELAADLLVNATAVSKRLARLREGGWVEEVAEPVRGDISPRFRPHRLTRDAGGLFAWLAEAAASS